MIPPCHKSLHFGGRVKGALNCAQEFFAGIGDYRQAQREGPTLHTPKHQLPLLSEVVLAQLARLSMSYPRAGLTKHILETALEWETDPHSGTCSGPRSKI